MASEPRDSDLDPQIVGNTFVDQYYNILSQCPEFAQKFYQERSVITRPVANSLMRSETTLAGIHELILSLDYKDCIIEILTADAQDSFGDGIVILVTGFLTGKDRRRRKFTQLFFLAPQENEKYFVMNDVLRYVDDEDLVPADASNVDEISHVNGDNPVDLETETPNVDTLETSDEFVEEYHPDEAVSEIEADQANESAHFSDELLIVPPPEREHSEENNAPPVSEAENPEVQTAATDATAHVEAPKKTYASIVTELQSKKQPFQYRVPPVKPFKPFESSVAPEVPPVVSETVTTEKKIDDAGKGYSIFVANLPMNASVEQLTETFQRFGPIKQNGIQVRSYKQERNCFGFVEFESADSMKNALEVAFIMVGNRRAHIEEKKAGEGPARFGPRRGGFRTASFRGRGGFGGGRRRNGPENEESFPGNSPTGEWGDEANVMQNGRGGFPRFQTRMPGN